MQKPLLPLYLVGIRGGAQGGRQLGHAAGSSKLGTTIGKRADRRNVTRSACLLARGMKEACFFFFPFSNSGVCFPSRWAVPYSWLVGWSLCSLLRCGGRSSCQKRCSSEQKSFLLVDTDVPLRRTRNAKRPRTGQDREWSGERKTLWLWSRGAGTPSLRQMLLVTIDLRKLHERQPV